MTKCLLTLLVLGCCSIADAGGDWAEAKVTRFEFNKRGEVVFELDWAVGSGHLSASADKRFVFEYHNWPSNSQRWLYRLLRWPRSDEELYPRSNMAACQNLLVDAFRRGTTVHIGQTGSVFFRTSDFTPGAYVVPYADVGKEAGVDVCFLYAAPI